MLLDSTFDHLIILVESYGSRDKDEPASFDGVREQIGKRIGNLGRDDESLLFSHIVTTTQILH